MWETARVDTLEENESQEVKPVALGHLGRGGTRTLHVYTPLSDRRPEEASPVLSSRDPQSSWVRRRHPGSGRR